MNLSLIVTLVVAAYAVILGVIYMLKASKRSWVMAIVRIGVTVASALAAIPLTRMLADLTADTVYGFLRPYLGDEIVSFLDQVPVGAEGMRVLAALLVSPLLYLLVFLILRWTISLVVWIVETCVPFLRRRSLRGVSMPLGAVNGILVAVVTLIPLCGYLAFGTHLLDTVVDSGMMESSLVRENLPNFTEEDAEVVKECLRTLFVNDASAARPDGSMEVVKLYWWRHRCKEGQYSSAKVHRSVKVALKDPERLPSSVDDYVITLEELPGLEPEVIDGI